MYSFNKILVTDKKQPVLEHSHYLWPQCLSDKLVNDFITIGESLGVEDGRIGDYYNNNINSHIRNSQLSWIYYNHASQHLYEHLQDIIERINYYNFGFNLFGIEIFQYSRYRVDGHYDYHNDIIYRQDDYSRKLSLVIGITDCDHYQGGELLLNSHGTNPDKIRLGRGDLIVFPSYIPHKVTPVTEGKRITVVSWVVGPKFV